MGVRRDIFSKRAARVASLAMAAVLSQAVGGPAAFSQTAQEPAAATTASAQSTDSGAAQDSGANSGRDARQRNARGE